MWSSRCCLLTHNFIVSLHYISLYIPILYFKLMLFLDCLLFYEVDPYFSTLRREYESETMLSYPLVFPRLAVASLCVGFGPRVKETRGDARQSTTLPRECDPLHLPRLVPKHGARRLACLDGALKKSILFRGNGKWISPVSHGIIVMLRVLLGCGRWDVGLVSFWRVIVRAQRLAGHVVCVLGGHGRGRAVRHQCRAAHRCATCRRATPSTRTWFPTLKRKNILTQKINSFFYRHLISRKNEISIIYKYYEPLAISSIFIHIINKLVKNSRTVY